MAGQECRLCTYAYCILRSKVSTYWRLIRVRGCYAHSTGWLGGFVKRCEISFNEFWLVGREIRAVVSMYIIPCTMNYAFRTIVLTMRMERTVHWPWTPALALVLNWTDWATSLHGMECCPWAQIWLNLANGPGPRSWFNLNHSYEECVRYYIVQYRVLCCRVSQVGNVRGSSCICCLGTVYLGMDMDAISWAVRETKDVPWYDDFSTWQTARTQSGSG